MSIRSIGTVLTCLQHNQRLARPSAWAQLPTRVFSSLSICPQKSTPSEHILDSTTSHSLDSPEPSAEAGVRNGSRSLTNFDPTVQRDTTSTPRLERKQREREIPAEEYESPLRIYYKLSDPTVASELKRDRFWTPAGPAINFEYDRSPDQAGHIPVIHLRPSRSPHYQPRQSSQEGQNSVVRRMRSVLVRHVGSIRRSNRSHVHVPKASQVKFLSPSERRIWKRAQQADWFYLYSTLAFPEDGDILQARKSMASYQAHAADFLAPSQRPWNAPLAYKAEHMVSLLIGGLVQSPKSTLDLMALMENVPGFSWRIQCNCLTYLRKVYWSAIETEPGIREMYDSQIEKVAVVNGWPRYMPQSALLAMLTHSSVQRRQNIIDSVLTHYDPVPVPLLLAMVDYYTKQELPEHALAILSRIPPEELRSLEPRLYGRYHNLIKIDNVERNPSGLNFQILPKLVETGLPLTENMHNEVLERAVKLGLPDVAWEVYRFMEANKIDVDPRRHLVLLRNSFQRGDLDGLNLIMSKIYQRKDLFKDPFLVSYTMNIVRYVCYFERQLPVTESLAHILAVYDRAYNRTPLVKLGIADPLPPSGTGETLPQPDGPQLSFTLWTYVLVQRSDYQVTHFWHHFIHLVKSGERDMCAAACHDILYNGLILFWCRKRDTLMNAVDVLEEMERLGLSTPTEVTWVLLIFGFMKHGQEAAAEKIRQMMIARGVETNPENWHHLLKEFSDSNLAARVEHDLGERRMPHGQKKPLDQPENHQSSDCSSVLDWKKIEMMRAPV